ncbi:large ribosomal subunit protein eL28-like [Corticium candelabrum]|uniref:large ribosomal subunit protein eL28-like n=1 Tax=Corticium candelabrum TaxID=121492 RepID=UPI002E270214|nr:large ribosomal subunit protein eL28-like [Corticium candelabrum]
MSRDLQWLVIRKSSSYLLKSKTATFTKEPFNLMGKNSYKYNGLVNKQAIDIRPDPAGKGAIVSVKNRRRHHRPVVSAYSYPLLRGSRRAIRTLKQQGIVRCYRADLTDAAVRRTCAIYRSQRPTSGVQKRRSRKKRAQ